MQSRLLYVQATLGRLASAVKGLYGMRAGARPLPVQGEPAPSGRVVPRAPFAANVMAASNG